MLINNFVQLVLLSLLTKAQVTDSSIEDSLAEDRKRVTEWKYPFAPNDTNAADVFWGQTVKDLYRPLQNPFDPKTLKYIEESNAFTKKILEQDSSRDRARRTFESMYNYERISSSDSFNGTTYELYNPGSYTVDVLTRKVGNGPRQTLVDPRSLFEKDTTKIGSFSISKSGKYLAYGASRKGSDWHTFFVIDLATGKQIKDTINWGRYTDPVEWKDDEGFYYEKYQQPEGVSLDQAGLENNRIVSLGYYFHKIGTDQSEDTLIQSAQQDSTTSTRLHYINSRYLLTINESSASQADGNPVGSYAQLLDLNQRSSQSKSILSGSESSYIEYRGSDEEGIEFITDVGAKYRQLVKVKFNSLDKYDVIVSEIKDQLLYNSISSGTKRVNFYYWDGVSLVTYTEKDGDKPKEIKIPFGDANSASFAKDGKSFTFKLASFLYIYQEYEYNFETQKLKLKSTKKAPGFDGDEYDQYLTHYKAKDGTDIPILLAHRKGIRPDKSRAGILYGYGGFNIQYHPGYNPKWTYLIKEKDMVLAYALIRGGGERGKEWWKSAAQKNKPISYSDYSDAVDFLHNDSKYGFVGKKKQFITGRSNGGLLTAATCNLIPEKLGGCFADVGVHDILRYQNFTGGSSWKGDYGFPQDSKEMFEVQLKFSPLQNVLPTRKGNNDKYYPYFLINTGDYDDRVSPAHSLKLAAEIQNKHRKSPNPVLLYVEKNSGHTASNTPKLIEGFLNLSTLINLSLKRN